MTCECGDHAFAAITKGHTVIVSPCDAPVLGKRFHAVAAVDGRRVYACGYVGGRKVYLHRMLLETGKRYVDHINGNPLDNPNDGERNG